MSLSRALLTCVLVAAACGDDDAPAMDGGAMCVSDPDCDDGLFCNGVETCSPEAAGASDRGCAAGSAPCAETCNEAEDSCSAACPDNDRDGFASADCGGADCDDDDPERYPGNVEICDADGRDEDCDPRTLGPDEDGDGYVPLECCNQQASGALRCGLDCNDSSRAIAPGVVDPCGNGDEDCDGDVDEDPGRVLYRDLDGDGQGTRDDTILGCEAGSGYVLLGDDCDDADDRRSPDFEEVCDTANRDEDCDGLVNPGCPCIPGEPRVCGATSMGECALGTQSCIVVAGDVENARWGECVGARGPRDELCNGLDDDCDGAFDETFTCRSGESTSGTNACGREGTRVCNADSCVWQTLDFATTESVATCDYCDDTGQGVAEALATADESIALFRVLVDGGAQLLGDAKRSVGPLGIPPGEWCFKTLDSMPDRLCLSDPTHVGALATDPVVLGYEGFTFHAPFSLSGDSGVGVSLVEPGPEPLLGPGGAGAGVPLSRTGIAVEWRLYDPATLASGTPTLVVRRLQEPADLVLSSGPAPARPSADDWEVIVTLVPDVPLSPTNETTLEISGKTDVGFVSLYRCGPPGAACPFSMAAGTPLEGVISSSVLPGREGAAAIFDGRHTSLDLVVSEGICP